MKMLLIITPQSRAKEVLKLIEANGVHGFTEIPGVQGSGKSGRHMGTRAFPGASTIIFTIAGEEETRGLVEALEKEASEMAPGEGGLHAFELETAKVV